MQRTCFQRDPDENVHEWDDERICAERQRRVAGSDGFGLRQGPVLDETVLKFHSYVCELLRHGNVFLVGDAGHTVPPAGAKGPNLAFSGVRLLVPGPIDFLRTGDDSALAGCSAHALGRVWQGPEILLLGDQPPSGPAGESPFARRRRRGEFRMITTSRHGSAFFAGSYTGRPDD